MLLLFFLAKATAWTPAITKEWFIGLCFWGPTPWTAPAITSPKIALALTIQGWNIDWSHDYWRYVEYPPVLSDAWSSHWSGKTDKHDHQKPQRPSRLSERLTNIEGIQKANEFLAGFLHKLTFKMAHSPNKIFHILSTQNRHLFPRPPNQLFIHQTLQGSGKRFRRSTEVIR